jgi:hypothetical protein
MVLRNEAKKNRKLLKCPRYFYKIIKIYYIDLFAYHINKLKYTLVGVVTPLQVEGVSSIPTLLENTFLVTDLETEKFQSL